MFALVLNTRLVYVVLHLRKDSSGEVQVRMNQKIFFRFYLIRFSKEKNFVSAGVSDDNDDVGEGEEYCFKAISVSRRVQKTLLLALGNYSSTRYLIFRVCHGSK